MSEPRLTRRECLTRGAGAVLATGAAAAGAWLLYDPGGDADMPGHGRSPAPHGLKNYFADVDFPPSHPRISIATGQMKSIEQVVRAAVGGLDPVQGMRRFISAGDRVLLKPNVGFDRPPHLGATTHPEVLRAVIRLCQEAGAGEIVITDNPIEAPQACFARSGIQQVARTEGARIVLPTSSRFEMLVIRDRKLDVRRHESLGRWPVLAHPLDQATKVIGVAPVKDHNLCSASMGLKNWYGLLGGRRNLFHQAIHNIVSDLAMMMSPTLVIADATRVMMRNGPTGGRPSDVKAGGELGRPAVVASVDPVACDAWCYQHLLGRDPARLLYLDWAHEKIQAQIAAGNHRFGQRSWQEYQRQGLVVTTSL